jgi:hypothetical protein
MSRASENWPSRRLKRVFSATTVDPIGELRPSPMVAGRQMVTLAYSPAARKAVPAATSRGVPPAVTQSRIAARRSLRVPQCAVTRPGHTSARRIF